MAARRRPDGREADHRRAARNRALVGPVAAADAADLTAAGHHRPEPSADHPAHARVSALAYALIHLGLYVFDLKFDLVKVASEIVLRFYLTIGFMALLAMAAMGATSFDSSIRRLGAERWNRLHSLIYPLALLSLWHGALQSKIDASEHIVMTGLFLALLAARFMRGAAG